MRHKINELFLQKYLFLVGNIPVSFQASQNQNVTLQEATEEGCQLSATLRGSYQQITEFGASR